MRDGVLRGPPKRQKCLGRTESSRREGKAPGAGPTGKGLGKTQYSVLNNEYYMGWWRKTSEPEEHPSQERVGLNLPLILPVPNSH